MNPDKAKALSADIKEQAIAMGFSAIGIGDVDIEYAGERLEQWLTAGYQGEMIYMSAHGQKRYRAGQLVPGTICCISVAVDYLPESMQQMRDRLHDIGAAYISRYALGRDYHKYLRKRLQKLADWIESEYGTFGYRVFTDSAPVMEKPLAEKSGLGWIGKHSNLVSRQRGSWFFLGEIYTDLPLKVDSPGSDHCGNCRKCIDVCPTAAIVKPYVVDARRCISYLTIEYKGIIPVELRSMLENRIFGCDDCQLACPWNRFASLTTDETFKPRHNLDRTDLVTLFGWSEEAFHRYTQGSALRRTGYECWLRNLAIALGNAPTAQTVVTALEKRRDHHSPLVREHIEWALSRHQGAIL